MKETIATFLHTPVGVVTALGAVLISGIVLVQQFGAILRILKVAIPLTIILGVVGFFAWPHVKPWLGVGGVVAFYALWFGVIPLIGAKMGLHSGNPVGLPGGGYAPRGRQYNVFDDPVYRSLKGREKQEYFEQSFVQDMIQGRNRLP